MTRPAQPSLPPLLLACCLAIASSGALAAEDTAATETTPSTAVGTSATTEAKLAGEFAAFLGGEDQARSVVSGLRQGTAIELSAAPPPTGGTGGTATTTTTTIDPPTGTMGYGNVRITLRLAEAQLAQAGITQPSAEELSAVLLGGTLNGTEVKGILALRADGLGWGQIAREYGTTVGQIMGKGASPTRTAPTTATTSAQARTSTARANAYLPSGGAKTTSVPQARSNGYIPSGGGKSQGALVTADGSSVGAASAGHGKNLYKPAAGGAGKPAVAAGGAVSAAGGQGASALAPGQLKKN